MSEQQFGLDLGDEDRRDGPLFDPRQIRFDALAIIAEARNATAAGPWDADELHYKRILFPHLVSWLPDADERSQLCFEFSREADRIELLLAA